MKILVLDDDAAFRESLGESLADLDFDSEGVGTVKEALEALARERFAAVIVDYRLRGEDGLSALTRIRAEVSDPPPVLMLTAYTSTENTIRAMSLGAAEHLTKPLGVADLRKVLERLVPKEKGLALSPPKAGLVTRTPAMQEVLKLIGRAAGAEGPVLITGETGTGKEVVAHAIHQNGPRAGKPFVAINCAALPAELLESELFGHERGAFTGADRARIGAVQRADGGTLFLDEIGDMNLGLQAKILRALQEREIVPVGGDRPRPVDARIITATHRRLPTMIEEGKFRADLFYRINVLDIALPPLRERRADIPLLASQILGAKNGPRLALSEAARDCLLHYDWPGNVRELKNALERAAIVAAGGLITPADIRLHGDLTRPPEANGEDEDLPRSLARLERRMIETALRRSRGNRTEAARRLGIQRQLLYTKMKEYRIDVPRGEEPS
jgi:DNA-binding NtrC family response regulator